MRKAAHLFAVPILAVLASGAQAQPAPQPIHHPGLGSLHFPTSGAPAAQADFERGVLLMHSFEYGPAAAAFRAAREKDPAFAMAYWGEAMTHNHPIWNEQDREAALAVLDRYAPSPAARAAKAPTHRERMYLEAVDVLYGEGSKAARDTAYFRAMEALAAAHPEDYEARAFQALAILGLSRGARDVPSYMRAGAMALELFQENFTHPGAAHYVIHSFDDPTHAPLGLRAAEAYADVAPEAAHAQHMTTHIFLALGMWDGVVAANERAAAVVDRARAADGRPPTQCGHYNEWLSYGYAQQGRSDAAEAVVLGCLREAAAEPGRAVGAAYMRALYVGATEDLDGAVAGAALDAGAVAADARPTLLAFQDWTAGYVAARQGRPEDAALSLAALEKNLDADPELVDWMGGYAPIWRGTLRSVVAAARGDLDGAIAAARSAAEYEATLPVDFGPPVSLKPPRELEAELLLAAGRMEEARTAFLQALARTPERARAVVGLEAVEAGSR